MSSTLFNFVKNDTLFFFFFFFSSSLSSSSNLTRFPSLAPEDRLLEGAVDEPLCTKRVVVVGLDGSLSGGVCISATVVMVS
jgi:hypothetical protein